MQIEQYKTLFIVITAILALFVASPALQRILVYPETEFFTELWLLGPEQKAENYPYNITQNQNYSVFLGIANYLGYCAYYQVEVKFRNETQSAPNAFNLTSSSLQSLYNFTAFIVDNENLELSIIFSFNYSFVNDQIKFESMTFNGVVLNLQGYSSDYNATTNMFYGNLIFELWIYNNEAGVFQYHERYVDLKFNLTTPT